MNSWFLPAVIAGIPVAALLGFTRWARGLHRSRRKTPFTKKLLRPPGESLREEIVRLDEKLWDGSLNFVGVCGWIIFVVLNTPPIRNAASVVVVGVLVGLGYAGCAVIGVRLYRTAVRKANYELGFLGERAVAEELTRMISMGYWVFHDVPFEGAPGSKPWNLDHVAVGPGGVFSIETKTRRKLTKNDADAKPNVVEFDGVSLIYPWGSEDFGLKQARDNARGLSAWLRQAAGFEIDAIPVLALPGWSVVRRGLGEVRVVSGAEICSAFPPSGAKAIFTADQIKQIQFHLEQRCRNVAVE